MWNDRFVGALWSRAVFDPATLTAGAVLGGAGIATSLVGSGVSASGTLAGGDYAKTAGTMQKTAAYAQANEQEFEAAQTEQNATQAFAANQRQAQDARLKTSLAISSSTARAGASGVNAGVGSPETNVGELAERGEYNALMDMFNGESARTGLLNKAAGQRYGATLTRFGGDFAELEGEEKAQASRTAALATLASGTGSALSNAGKVFFPTPRGPAGV
jgi:hypothetical protein